MVNCVILAAGKGTRMKSGKAKVLHEVAGAPMVHHVLNAVQGLPVAKIVVVVGHQQEAVVAAVEGYPVIPVVQEEQLGTGHAVACTALVLKDSDLPVLILCGDTPLIRSETLGKMLLEHHRENARVTLMTTTLENPAGYGRIVSDGDAVVRIVEEKDAGPAERRIREINAGIYCVDPAFLFKALAQVRPENVQSEIYLTDIIEIASLDGIPVHRFSGALAEEVLGVNSRDELVLADRIMTQRQRAAGRLNAPGQ